MNLPHLSQSCVGAITRTAAAIQKHRALLLGLLAAIALSGCVLSGMLSHLGAAVVGAVAVLSLIACGSSGGGSGKNPGFVITGGSAGEQAGFSVSWAGDIDDDGIPDIVIGAPDSGSYDGAAYVVYGRDENKPDAVNLGNLSSSDGFSMTATAGNNDYSTGFSVGWAGDFNDDGIADLVVGDPDFTGPYGSVFGACFIVFGKSGGQDDIDLYDVYESGSSDAITIYTNYGAAALGTSVAGLGDITGDGIDDVALGAPGFDYVASAIVIGDSTASNFSIFNGAANIYEIYAGSGAYAYAIGTSLHSAGDVNGDGTPDLIVGAPDTNYYNGAVHVIRGNIGGDVNVDLSFTGFTIFGENGSDYAGQFVGPAGDLNDDGRDDVLLVAPITDSDTWKAYVIFGKSNQTDVALGSVGSAGFTITGSNSERGLRYAGAGIGDVDGDGIDDLALGAPNANNDRGAVYVIFGADGGPDDVNLNNLPASQGFEIVGSSGELLGHSINADGDVNGDGVKDILVGAPGANNAKGKVYVVHGGDADAFEDLISD